MIQLYCLVLQGQCYVLLSEIPASRYFVLINPILAERNFNISLADEYSAPPGARGFERFNIGSSWPYRCPAANRDFCSSERLTLVLSIPSTSRTLFFTSSS